jgi:AcrR family transcriptional regulator
VTTAQDLAANPPANPPAGRIRKPRRGPRTRKQILDAALVLFSQKGTARASVRDIAQAAGITDAAIYYHFPSKRELFEAFIEERGFTTALAELETAEVTVGPEEALPGIAESALALMYANRGFMKVLMVEAMAEDSVAVEEYRMLVDRWTRAEARILQTYAARGLLRTDAVDDLATQCVVTVVGAFVNYLMSADLDPSAAASPPPELQQQVAAAMRRIVQSIT